MCDYSLHGVKNRLAVEGEVLSVHKFHTGSKGLASKEELERLWQPAPQAANKSWWERVKAFFTDDPTQLPHDAQRSVTAVCIPPGTQLELQGIPPSMQRALGVGPREYVIFVQLGADALRYRDAFRFDNGCEVLIQNLNEHVQVEVLQFIVAKQPEAVPEPKPLPQAPRPEVATAYELATRQ
jgi:hypothetical protein